MQGGAGAGPIAARCSACQEAGQQTLREGAPARTRSAATASSRWVHAAGVRLACRRGDPQVGRPRVEHAVHPLRRRANADAAHVLSLQQQRNRSKLNLVRLAARARTPVSPGRWRAHFNHQRLLLSSTAALMRRGRQLTPRMTCSGMSTSDAGLPCRTAWWLVSRASTSLWRWSCPLCERSNRPACESQGRERRAGQATCRDSRCEPAPLETQRGAVRPPGSWTHRCHAGRRQGRASEQRCARPRHASGRVVRCGSKRKLAAERFVAQFGRVSCASGRAGRIRRNTFDRRGCLLRLARLQAPGDLLRPGLRLPSSCFFSGAGRTD